MTKKSAASIGPPSVMVLGVGAFAHSTTQILKDNGATVSTYLTRNYAHYPPSIVGPTYAREQFQNPATLIKENKIKLVVPMSIDWALARWAEELIHSKAVIFGPTGE